MLAYGQTGSGKTFTMGSGNNTQVLDHEVGIIPRVIRQLFEGVEERCAAPPAPPQPRVPMPHPPEVCGGCVR